MIKMILDEMQYNRSKRVEIKENENERKQQKTHVQNRLKNMQEPFHHYQTLQLVNLIFVQYLYYSRPLEAR